MRAVGGHAPSAGPNIVLIVLDATRASSMSCYGYERPTTPYLERFAEKAIVYEAAISPAGWTLPSHASMFTGLFPSTHGAHDEHKYLEPQIPTMAEIVGRRGYQTAAICHNPYVGPATGLERGFDFFNAQPGARGGRTARSVRRLAGRAGRAYQGLVGTRDSGARATSRLVQRLLRRFGEEGQPFFLFVHYDEAHAPYRLPRRAATFLSPSVPFDEALNVNQDPWRYLVEPSSMGPADFEVLTAIYDSAIHYLDKQVGEVLATIDELGLADNTLVAVTADHGENIGDHGLMAHKYCLYDTLIHVPLLVRYPAGIAAAGRVSRQVQTLDILPTVLGLLGESEPDGPHRMEGLDLMGSSHHPFAVAEQSRPDLRLFGERFPGVDVSRFDRALAALRTDDHKFVWASDGRHELFDLRSDPGELANIIDERPDLAGTLYSRLGSRIERLTPASPTSPARAFDDEVAARLRSLGYLE